MKQALPRGTTIPPAWRSAAVTNQVANDWLQSFRDPRLDLLVEEAIKHNLNLRQAAASVEIARQNVAVAGSQLLPQIGAKLGAATTRDLDESKWFNSTLAVAGIYWEGRCLGSVEGSTEGLGGDFQGCRSRLCLRTPVPRRNRWKKLVFGH